MSLVGGFLYRRLGVAAPGRFLFLNLSISTSLTAPGVAAPGGQLLFDDFLNDKNDKSDWTNKE